MTRLANKSILTVKPYVPGKPIEEVKRELGLRKVIKLASNENPYTPSPRVRAEINKAARSLNRYPDGDCYYLRQALSKKLKVKPQQLIFGNGSDELIVLAIRAFVGPKDQVIIAQPSFLVYDIASRIAGATIRKIPLKSFCYDLEAMKKAVTKSTKIIFIGNPDNPGGTYITQNQMKKFLQGLRKDILVFMDEAYFEYVTQKDYVDSIAFVKTHPNLMVTRTFSKMYGLAGLRIGYGIAQEKIIDVLNRIREPFNVNSLAQHAALACLKDQAYYRNVARKIQQQRQYLYASLRRLKLKFVESYANFIMINMENRKNVASRLLKKGVIVRDMGFWGLKNYIRVTIGTPQENRTFIKKLEQLL